MRTLCSEIVPPQMWCRRACPAEDGGRGRSPPPFRLHHPPPPPPRHLRPLVAPPLPCLHLPHLLAPPLPQFHLVLLFVGLLSICTYKGIRHNNYSVNSTGSQSFKICIYLSTCSGESSLKYSFPVPGWLRTNTRGSLSCCTINAQQ